jgi:Family of unknown function (DUF6171)
MIRLARHHLEARAADRPADYLDECSRAGHWEGDELVLTDEAYAALVARYQGTAPRRPGFLDMVRHFGRSIGAWAEAGFPVVSAVQFHQRVEVCRECEHYLSVPVPRCAACKCFLELKPWLATEKCPLKKW